MTNGQLKAIRELSNEQLIEKVEFYDARHRRMESKMIKEVRISSAKRIRAYAAELQARIQANRI